MSGKSGEAQVVISASFETFRAEAILTVTDAVITRLAITPDASSVAKGRTQAFQAIATFSDSTSKAVTTGAVWNSSSASVATVDSSGAAKAMAVGSTSISATYDGQGATASMTVTAAEVTGLRIAPTSVSLAKGRMQNFSATATYTDGSSKDVGNAGSWTSSASATVSVDAAGLAKALAVGSAQVGVQYQGQSASAAVAVTAAEVVSVSVAPAAISLAKGRTRQLDAVAKYSDDTSKTITTTASWSSSAATVATVSGDGVVSAVTEGNASVAASYEGKSGSSSISVTQAEVDSLDIRPSNKSLAKGLSQQFEAMATYSDTTKKAVSASWMSTAPAVATIGSSSGVATAKEEGTTQISALFGGKNASITLTVTAAEVADFVVTPTAVALAQGRAQQLTAIATLTDGSSENVTQTAGWSTSEPTIATVDAGLVRAVGVGTADVRASYKGRSAVSNVSVSAAVVDSIALTPATASIAKGRRQQFKVTAKLSDGSSQDVIPIWTSTSEGVATVDSNGLASALSEGGSQIVASYLGKIASAQLTVTRAVIETVTLTPGDSSLPKGRKQQLTAMAVYSDGFKDNITDVSVWTSSAPSVASVSTSGLVDALTVGETKITADYDTWHVNAKVAVVAAVIERVEVSANDSSASLPSGVEEKFSAVAIYSDSTRRGVTAEASWNSQDTAIATVSNASTSRGVVKAKAPGQTTISADFEGAKGNLLVTVTDAVLSAIQLTPSNAKLPKGYSLQMTAIGVYSDSSTKDLTDQATWLSSAPDNVRVDEKGLAVGISATTSDGAGITAEFNSVQGKTKLRVTDATLSRVEVTPRSRALPEGLTQQYAATGFYSDGSTFDLTTQVGWTSSDSDKARISEVGFVTALKAGSVTIQAATRGAPTVSSTATLTVNSAKATLITISPTSARLPVGLTEAFSASGMFTDGSTRDVTNAVTWASTNSSVATVSNASGTQGQAKAIAVGSATISAALDGVTKSAEVTVVGKTITKLEVRPKTATVASGNTLQFTATVTYTDETTQDISDQVVWKSDNEAVATVSNVAGSRGQTKGVAPGDALITAKIGGYSDTATVSVTDAVLREIAISPATVSIAKGSSLQLKAAGTYTDGTVNDITDAVTWSSNATAIVSIDNAAGSKGRATGVATGNASIVAELAGVIASRSVTVTAPVRTGFTIESFNAMPVGLRATFVVIGTYSDQSTKTESVMWASTESEVATIEASSGAVIAVASGSTQIQATTTVNDGNGLEAVTKAATLTVTAAKLTQVRITPPDTAISRGSTLQYAAQGIYSDESQYDLTTQVTWASSNEFVASINSTGLASSRILVTGQTTISAAKDGVQGSTILMVQ